MISIRPSSFSVSTLIQIDKSNHRRTNMLEKTTYKHALVLLAVFATEGGLKSAATGAMEATNSIENRAAREIDSPAGAGSSEPNLSVGSDGRVYLSWFEPVQPKWYALKFAVRARGGKWSAPRTI